MVLVDENSAGVVDWGNWDDYTYYYVCFTASKDYHISDIDFWLYKEGAPGILKTYIYSSAGSGQPDTLIETLSQITNADVTTSGAWINIAGATTLLTKGVKYCIVFEPTGTKDGSNRYKGGTNAEVATFPSGHTENLIACTAYPSNAFGLKIYGTLYVDDNYVTKGQKELKTSYKTDTPEVGNSMHLVPQDGTLVLRRNRAGIK